MKSCKRSGMTLLILFLSVACVPSTYKVVSENEQIKPVEVNSRKLVVINSSYNSKASTFSRLINARNWSAVNRELNKVDDRDFANFLNAVVNITKKNYQGALPFLALLDDTDFDCQVKVLKADCQFELKNSTQNFLKEYQDAADCTSNENVKSIIIKRYRFVKYGI